ncbi:MAG: glycosyltransferase, partial [Flavobacterium sp.]
MTKALFSILITTKNRLPDLVYTLQRIQHLIEREDVVCVICDDGSQDGTSDYIRQHYPNIILHTNDQSRGYLYCRNKMLNETKADYAISLDDDAHFITAEPLESIATYFEENPKVGLLGLRVFWSKEQPSETTSTEYSIRMKSFVGCGHVWRMTAWRTIPNYPEWFVFYGEEDFASYQLFKQHWEIHYLPQVLVHHRVDIKARKTHADYSFRLRRSLRSGWYLYFLFYPLKSIPRKMGYSLWMQFKLKVFKGDWKALQAILLGLLDLLMAIPMIIKNSNRLTIEEYMAYQKLEELKSAIASFTT